MAEWLSAAWAARQTGRALGTTDTQSDRALDKPRAMAVKLETHSAGSTERHTG